VNSRASDRNAVTPLRGEEALRLTEFSVSQASDMVAWFDPEGRFLFANDAFCRRLGYTLEELLGMNVYDVSPEAVDLYDRHWAEMKKRGSVTFETNHRVKTGEVYPVEVVAYYVEHEGREYNVTFTRDSTERKRLEREQQITAHGIEHLGLGLLRLDSQGRIRETNEYMSRMLGYSREELRGMTVFDLDPITDQRTWPERWEELRKMGSSTFEREFRAKDGRTIPVEISFSIVEFEGEEFDHGFIRDITERKHQEELLRTATFSMKNAAVGIVWLRPDGSVHKANREICRQLGYSEEELLSMKVFDFSPSVDADSWSERWVHIRESSPLSFERELRRKNGVVFPVEVTSWTFESDSREYVCAFVLDITDQKRSEVALREREEQLRQSQKMEAIGQLAGGIAHDFNNLLTAILGYSDLTLSDPVFKTTQWYEDLCQIRSAGERAGALTQQILAFSRRQELHPQVVSINSLIEETLPLLRRTLGENIDLVTSLDPALAPVEVDPHQFTQILMNLAVNARDAMPSGGTLSFETSNMLAEGLVDASGSDVSPGDYVVLIASDTGMGMDPETVDRVFEPFFTTKALGQGTGLGLSTVYGIITQSGGTIAVASSPGEGTTFRVLLPRSTSEIVPEHSREEGTTAALPPATILVVEDEEAVRGLIKRALEESGHRVYLATTGLEAVTILESCGPEVDLLITDVMLPGGLDGVDVMRLAMQAIHDLAVLFISGYAGDAFLESDLGQQVPYMQKPFNAEDLRRKVFELLEPRPRHRM